jgi:hypothetical protein
MRESCPPSVIALELTPVSIIIMMMMAALASVVLWAELNDQDRATLGQNS